MMRWRSPSSRRGPCGVLSAPSRRPLGAALARQHGGTRRGTRTNARRPQHTLLFCRPPLRLGSPSWVLLSSFAILALPRHPRSLPVPLPLPHIHPLHLTHTHSSYHTHPTPHTTPHTPHTPHTHLTHLTTPHRTPRGSRWTASGTSFSSLRSTPRGWSGASANAPPPPSWRPSPRS